MRYAILAAALAVAPAANAALFVVGAMPNSSTGGVALSTIAVTAGQTLTVSSSTDDLWSAGALPRYSDANGLTGVRFATATDDSGQPLGTQIGANFGLWTQNGLSAPFGSLVGEIGGVFQLLGANFSGPAWNTGTLNLYYWDSFNPDNTGRISFDVNAGGGVPESATWAMMLAGFALVGAVTRRRAAAIAA